MADFQLTVCGSLVLRAYGRQGCWALLKFRGVIRTGLWQCSRPTVDDDVYPLSSCNEKRQESSSESAVGDGFAGLLPWLKGRDEAREGWA